ncbi:MAG: SAM-dependent methyltransferase [Chitinophagaceae bacterium]|nr:SAM-dependent methyltransferase [Chitinophagaceae bacterium]
MAGKGMVYLVPSLLDESGTDAIPPYIIEAIKQCNILFVENERTARRYLKKIWKEIVIDDYEWFVMSDSSNVSDTFRQKLKEGKTIGIISEAGCPGVADPGQALVAIAQEMEVPVKPLVGPNSILLALMASGMNGQQFQFVGYLPIDNLQKIKTIKELEAESHKKNCTQIFIETPYRNNQLFETLATHCKPSTRLCIAVDLTGSAEWIKTRTVAEWKKERTDIHKRPAIFLLLAAH